MPKTPKANKSLVKCHQTLINKLIWLKQKSLDNICVNIFNFTCPEAEKIQTQATIDAFILSFV